MCIYHSRSNALEYKFQLTFHVFHKIKQTKPDNESLVAPGAACTPQGSHSISPSSQ